MVDKLRRQFFDTNLEVGRFVEFLRVEASRSSVEALTQQLGLGSQVLGKIIRGEVLPSSIVVGRVCEYYRLHPNFFSVYDSNFIERLAVALIRKVRVVKNEKEFSPTLVSLGELYGGVSKLLTRVDEILGYNSVNSDNIISDRILLQGIKDFFYQNGRAPRFGEVKNSQYIRKRFSNRKLPDEVLKKIGLKSYGAWNCALILAGIPVRFLRKHELEKAVNE